MQPGVSTMSAPWQKKTLAIYGKCNSDIDQSKGKFEEAGHMQGAPELALGKAGLGGIGIWPGRGRTKERRQERSKYPKGFRDCSEMNQNSGREIKIEFGSGNPYIKPALLYSIVPVFVTVLKLIYLQDCLNRLHEEFNLLAKVIWRQIKFMHAPPKDLSLHAQYDYLRRTVDALAVLGKDRRRVALRERELSSTEITFAISRDHLLLPVAIKWDEKTNSDQTMAAHLSQYLQFMVEQAHLLECPGQIAQEPPGPLRLML
ncbi:hypothetical protein T10_10606 [Trichinella papuae]|uniref:Uncharacterized protein n=1 Tax=Trichinella papuae TaxID=268474 RepID=A0A0V1MFS1_9BILA|nr:hypothetical protein T10_10606 [Trichinella papuae]